MGIGDWLFGRKRRKQIPKEFEGMMAEHDSSPLPEGQLTEGGGMKCPHCGNELSMTDCLQRRRPGAVGETECPRCRRQFKSH